MGVAGLLPQLRSITKRSHVSKYRGQTVAVDAYCLLHRGAYTCSRELVEGEPTDRYVAYCMGRIDLLTGAGVTPLVVFDGGRLPNKQDEERSRHRSREENRARARSLWAAGNKAAAMECYQRAVDISPAHAKQFVEALKRRNIAFVVAPYEADAQMAYLALNGLVDVVLTEDSDLLCYGCPKVFFKMDKTGEGEEVQLRDLSQAKELAFQGFGHDLFQEMCVLAGCDFADSLPGIGIKKAHQHLRRTRCFLKVVRALRFDGTKIPEGYERRVQRALWTFKHQRVYCPRRRAAVHLHEVAGADLAAGARVPEAAQLVDGEPDFLGPALPDDVAHAIAIGDLDPITKQPFADDTQGPCTAPLGADAAASGCMPVPDQPSLRLAPLGRQQQQQSGRGKSGQKDKRAGAANGTTLMNFGFVRGLAKPAAAADFKPPRPSSAPGSQENAGGEAAAPQQRQQQPAAGSSPDMEGQQEVSSPPPPAKRALAGAEALASPTEEQWENFRQRRHKGSGRVAAAVPAAAAAAAAARAPGRPAAAATTSAYFAAKPSVPGIRKPAPVASGGGLLARLRAALQPEEPSIDELLSRRDQQEACPSPTASGSSGAAEEGNQEEEEQQQQQQFLLRPGGSRPRFVVPAEPRGQQQQRQQQGQQPKTPLDLGLRSSPTIDDILGGMSAGMEEEEEEGEGQEQLPSLACSPVQPPRPSQRLWLPQRAAFAAPVAMQRQDWQEEEPQQERLDLISPAGPAFLQQQQRQQQQQEQITPGFYMSGGSEAGSDPRRLTSVPRPRFAAPAATPSSSSSLLRGQGTGGGGGTGAAAASAGAPTAAGAAAAAAAARSSEGGPRPFAEDPISSLRHIAAFQGEAEAAVDRAACIALEAASQAALRPLPPPPHLVGSKPPSAAVLAAGKRALLGLAVEKENGPAAQAGGNKRLKGGTSSTGQQPASNIFAGFALGKR